jgi:5'-nucleotidase
MSVTILHTNDFHGNLDQARFEKLSALRKEADLYLDNGDSIKTGNLGIPLRVEPSWALLDKLGCTASALGNRETHVLETAFWTKIRGANHPILCANLRLKNGDRPLPGRLTLEAGGLRIGIVGVMVAMVTERMKTRGASAFMWDDPIKTAISEAEALRPEVDLLIALTHIGVREDEKLAEATSLYDLILGGHSHTLLESPLVVDGTPILQAGSHGRYAGIYRWDAGALVDAKVVSIT